MGFAWIDDQFSGNALLPQRAMKSYRLAHRHLRVFLPVQYQYRSLYCMSKRDRAVPGMWVWPCTFPWSASTQHALKSWHAAGHHHHAPVAYTGSHDGGLETLRL